MQSLQINSKSYTNIYTAKVTCIQKWVAHLDKKIFWMHHSDCLNYLHVVHAS